MIARLVDQLVARLRQEIGPALDGLADRIVAGPTAAPPEPPALVVAAGKLEFASRARDPGPGQPRPQETAERFVVKPRVAAGPYRLAQRPLAGSLRARLISDPSGPHERARPLIPDDDFKLDPAGAAITLAARPPAGSVLAVSYSVVGIFTVREFQQALSLDIYAATPADAERLAALAAAAILTAHEALIDHYNSGDPTEYRSGPVATRHSLSQIALLGGQPFGVPSGFQLALLAHGQIRLSRTAGDVGLIEHVRSPGRGGAGVDIAPELEA